MSRSYALPTWMGITLMAPLFCGINYYSSPPSMSISMNSSMPFYVPQITYVCFSTILLSNTRCITVKSPIKLPHLETIFNALMISMKITAIHRRITLNSNLEKYARVAASSCHSLPMTSTLRSSKLDPWHPLESPRPHINNPLGMALLPSLNFVVVPILNKPSIQLVLKNLQP